MVYRSVALNAAGVGLFIVSDIFDSADGQLARMRKTSTRFGRILDGISDNLRFINLYVHLLVRLALAGVGLGGGGARPGGRGQPLVPERGRRLHAAGVPLPGRRQRRASWTCPRPPTAPRPAPGSSGSAPSSTRTTSGGRRGCFRERSSWCAPRATEVTDRFRADYRGRSAARVVQCAWIGQNMRFLLLAVTVVPGWPAGFFWLTVGPAQPDSARPRGRAGAHRPRDAARRVEPRPRRMPEPASPERRYRGAIVGLGGIAHQSHLPALRLPAASRLEIVAAVDAAPGCGPAPRHPAFPDLSGSGRPRRGLHRHLHADRLASRPHALGPGARAARALRKAGGGAAGGGGADSLRRAGARTAS